MKNKPLSTLKPNTLVAQLDFTNAKFLPRFRFQATKSVDLLVIDRVLIALLRSEHGMFFFD